jgi:hypothetical protein
MRRLLFALVFGLVGGGLAVPTIAAPEVSQQEVVRAWNDLALNAVRVTRASDADAARTYAILNVAVYDAVNGIVSAHGPRKRAHALVPGRVPGRGTHRPRRRRRRMASWSGWILTAAPPTTPSLPPTLPACTQAAREIWG